MTRLDNPIAVREWRRLRRRAGSWRTWAGLKRLPDSVLAGVTLVLSYSAAPYGFWLILESLCRFHAPDFGKGDITVDFWSALALTLSLHVVWISLELGATSITHERARGTWDQLRLTAMSPRERGDGFLWGRLGPVWASVLTTAGIWWLCQPSYAALWAGSLKAGISRSAIAQWALMTLGLSFVTGEVGLQSSARCKSTAVAVVVAYLIAAPLVVVGALGLGGPLVITVFGSSPPLTPTRQVTSLLFLLWCFVSLSAAVWHTFTHPRET